MSAQSPRTAQTPAGRRARNPRGVFERKPGEWWVRYVDAQGRLRREKAGSKSVAIALYHKRKAEALAGRKLPETLRRAPVSFAEIAHDALAYSKAHKRSYRDDAYRMGLLLEWFGTRAAESITAPDIERALATAAEQYGWSPGTVNRYRSLLSLTYRLGIRSGKVRENPVRQVARRKENNLRVRFLDPEEEERLRTKIRELCPDREPEFDLALHTGLRRNELWRLRWQDVNFQAGLLTVREAKNGQARHIPLNMVAEKALLTLSRRGTGEYVLPGPADRTPRTWDRWFERCVRAAGIADFRYHDLRHTFASRLVMAGVPLRTLAELLGHRTLSVVMRYAHLSPGHLREAVERLAQAPIDTRTDTGHLHAMAAKELAVN
jgi:site-specific recombinase XerD